VEEKHTYYHTVTDSNFAGGAAGRGKARGIF